MVQAVHLAVTGEMRNAYKMSENVKGRDHLENPGVDGRIILEWIIEK